MKEEIKSKLKTTQKAIKEHNTKIYVIKLYLEKNL